MSEPDQELEIITTNNNNGKNSPEILSEESIDFTLLRLDSFNSSCKTNSTTHYHTPCRSCGCSISSIPVVNISSSSNKRRSPDCTPPIMYSHDQIPKKPKKLFLEPQENQNPTIALPSLRDFSRITLPWTSSPFGFGATDPAHINFENRGTNSLPTLRRCHSDPYNPPVSGSDSIAGSATAKQVPQSPPESAKIAGTTALTTPASKGTASLPPRPPTFQRTSSDPSPNKSFSLSSSSIDMTTIDGSSHFKWLKRMRDCMKEMSQWWDEVLPTEVMAEEEEDRGTEDKSTDIGKAELVTEFEEAVSVERTGDCLVVHFKCPCSRGYQILLSGRDCYYKLL